MVIKGFSMANCKPVNTPFDVNQKLSKKMCPKTDAERAEVERIAYQEAIGCIMYATLISRPDICFAVSFLSRCNIKFGLPHWEAKAQSVCDSYFVQT